MFGLGLEEDAVSKPLPPWKPGYLDIHHLRIGPGQSSFLIMPDGTTMLMDGGDVDLSQSPKELPPIRPTIPNDSKTTGGWILDYVHTFWPATTGDDRDVTVRRLDYALLSHFHPDHLGEVGPNRSYRYDNNNQAIYQRTGLTEVLSDLPTNVLVDRAYPSYDFPADLQAWSPSIQNYVKFVHHLEQSGTTSVQAFDVGSHNQFRMMHTDSPNVDEAWGKAFSIFNLKANVQLVADSSSSSSRTTTIPGVYLLKNGDWLENEMSTALLVSYGDFSYYEGADQEQHEPSDIAEASFNVISPVARVAGKVDVATANHHGSGTNSDFCDWMDPKVVILQGLFSMKPPVTAMELLSAPRRRPRMGNKKDGSSSSRSSHLRGGHETHSHEERVLLATDMYKERLQAMGPQLASKLVGINGHIVVRVSPPGPNQTYIIYLLEADTKDRKIVKRFGPFRPEHRASVSQG